jgi:hypothetical protein
VRGKAMTTARILMPAPSADVAPSLQLRPDDIELDVSVDARFVAE